CRWSWTTRAGWKRTQRRSRRFAGRPRASVHAQGAAATVQWCVRSDCRWLRSMVSPKTSRPAQRRSVPLASGLGLPPMTLDLDVICISGVPISGIAAIGAASARQFSLGDVELVGLAGLDDAASLSDATGNHAAEMTVTEPVEEDLDEVLECLAQLRSTGLSGACLDRFVMHCAAKPSCP